MNVYLNEVLIVFEGKTISELLREIGKEGKGLAVAIEQTIIPRSQWSNTFLLEGTHIDMFESIAGG